MKSGIRVLVKHFQKEFSEFQTEHLSFYTKDFPEQSRLVHFINVHKQELVFLSDLGWVINKQIILYHE